MSRLTRDGTAEPVSRDQILRHARGQGDVHFPCSADHEQDWQPYPVDPYSAICDDHTYIRATVCLCPFLFLFLIFCFFRDVAFFRVFFVSLPFSLCCMEIFDVSLLLCEKSSSVNHYILVVVVARKKRRTKIAKWVLQSKAEPVPQTTTFEDY